MQRVVRLFAAVNVPGSEGGETETVDWASPVLVTKGRKFTETGSGATAPGPGGGLATVQQTTITVPALTNVPLPGYLELDGQATERFQIVSSSEAMEFEAARTITVTKVTQTL